MQPKKTSDPLDVAVTKLIDGALGSKPCVADTRKSIGLWTFDEEKIPVGAAAARRLHQELVSRLLAERPKCIDVIDSAGIGVIIDHLNKTGALQRNGGNPLAALNEANEQVDIVAFLSLYNQGGKTVLALRAVERTSGKTLALTTPIVVPAQYLSEDVSDKAISLDAAISAASKYLSQNAANLKVLRPLGIFFEDTGAQPAAGRYLMDRLVAALSQEASNVITGKVLKVRGLAIEPRAKADGPVDSGALEKDGNSEVDRSTYDLTGRYWVRGNAVDVRLSMKQPDGGTIAWQGKVRLADFKDLELRPRNLEAAKHPLPQGAFAFQLTSPKGTAPIYRPGEELALLLRLGQEASLYCFYVDSKGQVLTVLPNPVRGNDPTVNRFKAKTLYRLPDVSRDPFKFVFTPDTAGEELVDCFASTRDVRADLPKELFPDKVRPVPFLTLDRLRDLFGKLKDTKVSEASVTVTVAR